MYGELGELTHNADQYHYVNACENSISSQKSFNCSSEVQSVRNSEKTCLDQSRIREMGEIFFGRDNGKEKEYCYQCLT